MASVHLDPDTIEWTSDVPFYGPGHGAMTAAGAIVFGVYAGAPDAVESVTVVAVEEPS